MMKMLAGNAAILKGGKKLVIGHEMAPKRKLAAWRPARQKGGAVHEWRF
jgi:hypothetical protein